MCSDNRLLFGSLSLFPRLPYTSFSAREAPILMNGQQDPARENNTDAVSNDATDRVAPVAVRYNPARGSDTPADAEYAFTTDLNPHWLNLAHVTGTQRLWASRLAFVQAISYARSEDGGPLIWDLDPTDRRFSDFSFAAATYPTGLTLEEHTKRRLTPSGTFPLLKEEGAEEPFSLPPSFPVSHSCICPCGRLLHAFMASLLSRL